MLGFCSTQQVWFVLSCINTKRWMLYSKNVVRSQIVHCPSLGWMQVFLCILTNIFVMFVVNVHELYSQVANATSAKGICTVCHLASHSSLTTAKSRRRSQRREKELDPETRFMSVTVWREGHLDSSHITGGMDRCIMMCVASSDAQIRWGVQFMSKES